nr:reverse transcriptase domain-containing protein [Tanacetum cinerariifolium]
MIIEAEMGGHFVHRMYVDGGSSLEIMYEHYFNRFCPEIKSQMVLATTPLVGFSGEIIWLLGQISVLVKICDEEHSTSGWMNFMIIRTRNAAARNQPSYRRKDSGSNPPRISRANYSNRLHFDKRRAGGAMRPAKAQPRYIRLEASRYDRSLNVKELRVCPDKVESVLSLPSPKCLKDVQRLNGKLISFKKFLSKSAKKSFLFFKTLKKYTKKSDFQWTVEAEMAFKQMKTLIAEFPMLTAPNRKKELVIYLVAANEAVSVVLITKRNGKQMPIYFVSHALQGPKIYYTPTKKWILALITKQIGVKNLQANVDSRLVANQVNGTYIAKDPCMDKHLEKVKNLASAFEEFSNKQVPRGENQKTYTLSKMAFTSFAYLSKQTLVEELKEKSIDEKESNHFLIEIHKGSRSMHAGPRSVVVKALRSGYYWLTMHVDTRKLIRECNSGQVYRPVPKRANRSFGEGIKARLDERSKNWTEEISHVLLAHRTMIKSSNGETPFSLTYGTEEVRNISFRPGDLIYRSNEASHVEEGGKLEPKWEGPYKVTEALGKEAYKLREYNVSILSRTWNVCNLKKCYVHEM